MIVRKKRSHPDIHSAGEILSCDPISLKVGAHYLVYGLVFSKEIVSYYICADESREDPSQYAAFMFDVIDDSLDPEWVAATHKLWKSEYCTIIAPPKWAREYAYYERLIDNDKKALAYFKEYSSRVRSRNAGEHFIA